MKKCLHLISFDIPYPANYGGAIDVFYKIKALKQLDFDVILHCFEFNKEKQPVLNNYCSKVFYYQRNNYFTSFLSKDTPFIVKSRGNDELIQNLNKDTFPILFDGLHTTYILNLYDFSNRKIYLRAHNIEHNFYKGLANSESNLFKKRFFKTEAKKLKLYEKILHHFDGVFSIAPHEQKHFQSRYGDKCYYVPAFHNHLIETQLKTSEKFVLYHGNLSVSENVKAATFLITTYGNSNFKLVIASNFINNTVLKEIKKYSNIHFVDTSEKNKLLELFESAQIHVLPTFQKTGIKLKLLNTLYQGRFIIANKFMIEDTGLESLCTEANTPEAFLKATSDFMNVEFNEDDRKKRLSILKSFHPLKSAKKMIDIIFQQDS